MNGKGSNSLKELRSLRESVLAEEKAKAKAIIETLPPNELVDPVASAAPEISAVPAEVEPSGEPEAADDSTIVPLPEAETDPTEAEPAEFVQPEPTPSPAPEPVPRRTVPPVAQRPAVQGPPPRPKIGTKDPALIIPLTPKIKERLQRHVEQSRWSPADLVIELVRANLHRGYPAIYYGDQLLARAGTYRTIERNPFESVLKIVSGQGVFNIGVTAENSEYQRWLAYAESHHNADPQQSALQACLFDLERYLQSVDDYTPEAWLKRIEPEHYVIEVLT